MRVAVLASGSGSNLQALMDACQGGTSARVVLVASDRAACGALEKAAAAQVTTHVITNPADAHALTAVLQRHEIDLVVLAGYLKLVPGKTVDTFPQHMINIHPALLPAFGGPGMYGLKVHRAVLASGTRVTGATVHLVTTEYDRGPIVAQWPVPVLPGDTPDVLAARVLVVEHQLLPAVVKAAAAGRVVPLAPSGPGYAPGDPTGLAAGLEPHDH